MRQTACGVCANDQFVRLFFSECNELSKSFYTQPRRHGKNHALIRDHRNRDEIAGYIEWQFLSLRWKNREHRRNRRKQGIAIVLRGKDRLNAERSAGAGTILNYNLLAEYGRKLIGDDAGPDIRR